MRLHELLRRLDGTRVRGDADREVDHLTRDSREVRPGSVFVAIRGAHVDGHRFVAGLDQAAAVVVEQEVTAPPGVTVVRVGDTRRALPALAAALYRDPARTVKVAGITGTNGKTTVAGLVDGALREAGWHAGRIGTLGTTLDGAPRASALTTPESHQLQALLAEMREAGVAAVAMEVSSIGIVQGRVDGIPFHVGVFTNLGRDHLDFHGDMDAYAAAKSRLFTGMLREPGRLPRAVLCSDDPAWRSMVPPADRWLYGFGRDADVRVLAAEVEATGVRLEVETPMGAGVLRSPLVGRHNAQNLLGALTTCLCLGLELEAALDGLARVQVVPGRLEPVPNQRGLLVLVDYAHTEDALAAAMSAVREITRGRLWVVFGCGGDRDQGKRPRMGAVVERHADQVVVTSDNPRNEEPLRIIEGVLQGMSSEPALVEPDRAVAIEWALSHAAPGDAVLIAGKGHETTQELGDRRVDFDDRAVARAAMERG